MVTDFLSILLQTREEDGSGNHFAMMEGHLLLATLAQRVTFELVPGRQIVPDPSKTLTMRPKYGVKMIVRHRNG